MIALENGVEFSYEEKEGTQMRKALIEKITSKLLNGSWSRRAFLEAYATFEVSKLNLKEAIVGKYIALKHNTVSIRN